MSDGHLYEIALTLIKGVGSISGRKLLSRFGSAEDIFRQKSQTLAKSVFNGTALAVGVKDKEVLLRAEREVEFLDRNGIQSFFIQEEAYPELLKPMADAPLMLYYKGTARLDAPRAYSIVGTRKVSAYGKQITEDLVREVCVAVPDAVVVSGMAYGVDITAHRMALQFGAPTIGVLAHGLDRIYPSEHRQEATRMIEEGGLLTEFISGTQPERYNFVARNRIIAGLTAATVVVESGRRGGSLITAEIAFSYNREVFAFPGRVTDGQSEGCNHLIQSQKAEILLSSGDLIEAMHWGGASKNKQIEPCLFPDLTSEEEAIVALLGRGSEMHVNELIEGLDLAIYELSPILLELEFKGVVQAMAGGKYRLK